jgi:hypothetical protein
MVIRLLKRKFIKTTGFSQQWVVTICGSAFAKGKSTKQTGVSQETRPESLKAVKNGSTTEGNPGFRRYAGAPFGSSQN